MIKRKRTPGEIARRVVSLILYLLLIGVIGIVWSSGRDFSWALKDEIEARLTAETGHPVMVEGPIGFDLGWQDIHLFAGDITTDFGDEESAFEAAVHAERAGVTLGLWELMRGRVQLRGLVLREAEITLPVPEGAGLGQGDRNPEFIFRILNRLRRVTLDNLTLIRLRREGEPQTAEIDSLLIAPEGTGIRAAFVGDVEGTPYDVDGVITDLESFLAFEGSPATIVASIGRNNVEGRGTVQRLWPFEADLELSGEAENVARLAELMGGHLPGAGAGRLSGRLVIAEGRAEIDLSGVEVSHNGANGEAPARAVGPMGGTLSIRRLEGNRFEVNGGLSGEVLRIDPLLATPQGFELPTVAELIETPFGAGLPFAQRRIPYRNVRRLTGAVRLEVTELQFRDAVFRDVVVPLADADGVLRIEGARATYEGRPLALDFIADASTETVTLNFNAHRIEIGTLTEQLGGSSVIHGPALIGVEGSGTGGTIGEVLQTFTGQGNLMIGRGRLERGGIDFLAADLLRAFFSTDQGATPLVCLINRMDFEDGVGTSRAFLMDTNLITITGTGRVNLARNNIDFELAPRPKDPTLLSLAADYRVEGPIMNPRFSPRPGGIIRGVATTLGSLALTGGAAALLPLLARGGENDLSNPCISALVGEEEPSGGSAEEG